MTSQIDVDNEKGDIVVRLTENATGKVTLTVTNNTYILPIENSTAVGKYLGYILKGTYNVTASYAGDVTHMPGNITKEIEFGKIKSDLTIISDENFDVNQNLTILIVVPKDATGKVNVSVYKNNSIVKSEDITIDSNIVRYTIDHLENVGEYTIIARYDGDETYYESEMMVSINATDSGAIPITPDNPNGSSENESYKEDTPITLSTIIVENNVIFTAIVNKNATGLVKFEITGDKNITLYADVKDGKSILKYILNAGNYTITSTYLGDSRFVSNNTAKQFTLHNIKIESNNLSMQYLDGSKYIVRVYGTNGKPVGLDEIVTFKINNKEIEIKTTKTGYASLKITEIPNNYTITVTYKNTKISNTIVVNQILKSSNKNVKKSAKNLVLTATLSKVKGKYLNDKVIKFKFYGKTYKAKTNEKGVAKVTLNNDVIKKLKVGKKYIVKITYAKTSINKTVTVKK
ncbi:Ig-like domain-containing protein [Methanobrevibacter sp.]|uniref:Ig-like domain-containing protein n=1 Tax=Methanobrevibacter sp. TaxID=66852 RepID=UPI00386CD84F